MAGRLGPGVEYVECLTQTNHCWDNEQDCCYLPHTGQSRLACHGCALSKVKVVREVQQ